MSNGPHSLRLTSRTPWRSNSLPRPPALLPLEYRRTPTPSAAEPRVIKPPTRPPPDIPWLNQLARRESALQQQSTPPQQLSSTDDKPDKVKGSLDEVREYSLSLYRHLQGQLNKRKLNTRNAANIRRRSKRDTHWIQANGVNSLGGRASRNAIWTSDGIKDLAEMLDAGIDFSPPSDPKELKESFMKLLEFASSKKNKRGYTYFKPEKTFPIGKVVNSGPDISVELTTANNFVTPLPKQSEKIQQILDTDVDASIFEEEILGNEIEGVDNGLFDQSPNLRTRFSAALIANFEANNEEAELIAGRPPQADNFEDAEIIPPPLVQNNNVLNITPQTISEIPLSVDQNPNTVRPIPTTTSEAAVGPVRSLPYSLPYHQEQKVEWQSAYAGGEAPINVISHHHQRYRRRRPVYPRYRNRQRSYRTRHISHQNPYYFCPPYPHTHNDTLNTNKHPIFFPRRPAIPPPTLTPKSLAFPRVPTPPPTIPVLEVATIPTANPPPPPPPSPQFPFPPNFPPPPLPSPVFPVEPLTSEVPVVTFIPAVTFRPTAAPTPATTLILATTQAPVATTFRPNTPRATPIATQSPAATPFQIPVTTTIAQRPITAPPPVTTEPDYEYYDDDDDYNMDDDEYMDDYYYMDTDDDRTDDGVDDGLTRNLANPGTESNTNDGGTIKSLGGDTRIPVIILVEPDKIPEGAIPMVPMPTTTLPPFIKTASSIPGESTDKSVGNREKIPVIILVEPDQIPKDSFPINTDMITKSTTRDPIDYDTDYYDYDIDDDDDYDIDEGDYDTEDYNEYDEFEDENDYEVNINSNNDYNVDFDDYDYDNDYEDSYEYEDAGLLPLFPGPRGSARLRNRGRLRGRSHRNRNRGNKNRQQRLNPDNGRSSRLVQLPPRNQRRPNIPQTRLENQRPSRFELKQPAFVSRENLQQTRQNQRPSRFELKQPAFVSSENLQQTRQNQRPSRFDLTQPAIVSNGGVSFRDNQQQVFVRDDIPQHKLIDLSLQQNPSKVDTLTGSRERIIPFPSWLNDDYTYPESQEYYVPPRHPDYLDTPVVKVPRVPVVPVRPNSRRASSPNFIGGPVAGTLPGPGSTRSRGRPNSPANRGVPIPRNPPRRTPIIPRPLNPTLPNIPFPINPQPPLIPPPPPPPLAIPNPRPGFIPVGGNNGIPGINRPRQPFPQNPNVRIPGNREDIIPDNTNRGFSSGRDIEFPTIPNTRNRKRGNREPRIPVSQENFRNEFEDFGRDFEVFRPDISEQTGSIPEKITELRHSIVSKARAWTQFGLQRTRPEFIRTRRPDPQPQHIVIFQ